MKIYAIVITILLLSTQALADINCSKNSLGVTSCKDSFGNNIKSRTNSLGVTTYTDNHGNNVKARTNSLGVTTYTGNNG
ncbi:MAG: hypothetical protein IJE43_16070, partial [Alphaproteobacteria bacterium]|nr:hypothetical protein [Alphaproteobacteria bacterium]